MTFNVQMCKYADLQMNASEDRPLLLICTLAYLRICTSTLFPLS